MVKTKRCFKQICLRHLFVFDRGKDWEYNSKVKKIFSYHFNMQEWGR